MKLTRKQAENLVAEVSKLNGGRPFSVVPCVYMTGEKGWAVTPSEYATTATGAIGGSSTSKAKVLAARRNGKLGGRPKHSV